MQISTWTLVCFLIAVTCRGAVAKGEPKPFVKGMAIGHHTAIKPAKLNAILREVKALGADSVSIVVAWSTPDVRSTTIAPRNDYSTAPSKVVQMIKLAHARGLKVLLFPIIDVQKRKPLEWRGTIKPADWDAWWQSYHRFILHFASIAAKTKVEMLCVGSELVSTEEMVDRWKALIGLVRKSYKGRLLYSANWDHYRPVKFWNLVDDVGLTAYYSIAKSNTASVEEMVKGWELEREKLRKWSQEMGRPFLFTEVGYPSLDGGAVNPWDYTQSTAVDLDEQRRAYAAFVKAWSDQSILAGVFFWDWYGKGGIEDKNYTPRGKPAAKVIQAWFEKRTPAK